MTEGSLQWRTTRLEEWQGDVSKTVGEHTTTMAVHAEKHKKYDEVLEEVSASQRSINNWLRGIFGSVLVALVLLVFELVSHARAATGH